MTVKESILKGTFIIKTTEILDNRGSFTLNFNKKEFESKISQKVNLVLENESISKYGVIRGLHMQRGRYSQAKLVRVISGRILDVIVDVRKNSITYGEKFIIELSKENNLQLFIPRGFLHGFSVLEDNTIVNYKCDNYYNKDSEDGVIYNDLDLNIDWRLKEEEIILSKKDKELKTFKDFLKYKR